MIRGLGQPTDIYLAHNVPQTQYFERLSVEEPWQSLCIIGKGTEFSVITH